LPDPSNDLSDAAQTTQTRRQLPVGHEIFLDHLGHYVRDAEAAGRALRRVGFAPTPISIQSDKDPASGGLIATGTGNITAMFARGYMEVMFKTSDSPLVGEFDAALVRRAGLHIVAFSVADAAAARGRLASAGFLVRDLVRMQRPVNTENGPDIAAFTIARVEASIMPEGRIQILTHHTEHTVWQPRWLSHPNGVCELIDVVIAVGDVEEAARRFARFTGRPATPTPGGALIRLDRGGVYLVSHHRASEKLPEVPVTSLPVIIGYAFGVESLATIEEAVDGAELEWRAFEGGGIVATFPTELGEGAWFFVEQPDALPWRR
jgi:Glyoxalase-like domain